MTTPSVTKRRRTPAGRQQVAREPSPPSAKTLTIPPAGLSSSDPLQYRRGRALVGFLPEAMAVQLLLGRQPGPEDDTTAATEEAAAKRATVAARGPYVAVDPEVTSNERAMLDAVAQRPEIQALFAPHDWRVTIVDLRRVLAFQSVINVETLDDRLSGVTDEIESLIGFCLPSAQPPAPMGIFSENDGKGFAISSLNPNLRVVGSGLINGEVAQAPDAPPLKVMVLQTFVTVAASYLQVVHYSGRFFIRDGYHRAAGLLRAGITVCPCILIEARRLEEVGLQPGMVPYDTIAGDHPPLLSDFWNDEVASDINQLVTRKVVRLRADEFLVQG